MSNVPSARTRAVSSTESRSTIQVLTDREVPPPELLSQATDCGSKSNECTRARTAVRPGSTVRCPIRCRESCARRADSPPRGSAGRVRRRGFAPRRAPTERRPSCAELEAFAAGDFAAMEVERFRQGRNRGTGHPMTPNTRPARPSCVCPAALPAPGRRRRRLRAARCSVRTLGRGKPPDPHPLGDVSHRERRIHRLLCRIHRAAGHRMAECDDRRGQQPPQEVVTHRLASRLVPVRIAGPEHAIRHAGPEKPPEEIRHPRPIGGYPVFHAQLRTYRQR